MSLLLDALLSGSDVSGILSCWNSTSLWDSKSRIEVNHDGFGGTSPDAMVWDKSSIVKTRAPSFRLIIDHAALPGPSPPVLGGVAKY